MFNCKQTRFGNKRMLKILPHLNSGCLICGLNDVGRKIETDRFNSGKAFSVLL